MRCGVRRAREVCGPLRDQRGDPLHHRAYASAASRAGTRSSLDRWVAGRFMSPAPRRPGGRQAMIRSCAVLS
ncbi:unnamed protein product [Mycetohabitans rhizoxinica HKI 454]|uniref:Uncharacterized protein n=1 Tax=Mycetohabitans rhizoxinica (strain DSM 19002 / CIP 109453 / HKI 454) TaxID=882378 RepID=E5ALY6_MYCRK|nr:unnamed protein product [Mycetohabitans rhizoxinica HKI 454]